MCRFNTKLALFFVYLMLAAPIAALAADRLAIPASPCGPMMALQSAGKSVNHLPCLQHKDGSPLLPSEYRTAPDSAFYLPSDCEADAAKTAEALTGEFDKFGAAPKGGCAMSQGPSCEDRLATANAKIDKLNAAIDRATDTIDGLKKDLDAANKHAEAAEKNANGKMSWWWLLLPLAIAAVLGWLLHTRHNERNEAQEHNTELQNRLNAVPPDVATAQTERDTARRERAEMETQLQETRRLLDEAHGEIRNYMDRWNDPQALQARLDELNGPPTGRMPRRP